MPTRKTAASRSAIIIGGGIVALSCALELQRRGIDALIVAPRTRRQEASWGNAGHIAIEQIDPLASMATVKSMPRRLFWRGGALSLPIRDIAAWLPFSLRLLSATEPRRFAAGKAALMTLLPQAMPAWRALVATIGARDLLIEDGHFVLWETPRSAEAGRKAWMAMATDWSRVRDATDAEIAMLSARLKQPVAGAVRFLDSGQIADLPQLADAIEAAFARSGGKRRDGTVAQIDPAGGAVILDDGERLSADIVVLAAGAASGTLMAPLGEHVPIIAERGYHLQTSETDWPADMPPVVFEDRSMIVTRFRSGLRAASFVEFGRRASPPDPRKWARLRSHIAALGLPFPGPVTEWMGARPTLPDYLPAIGRSERVPGLFYAFGHQHLGLTLAPLTGKAIGALVAGEAPPIDLAPFDIGRFR